MYLHFEDTYVTVPRERQNQASSEPMELALSVFVSHLENSES